MHLLTRIFTFTYVLFTAIVISLRVLTLEKEKNDCSTEVYLWHDSTFETKQSVECRMLTSRNNERFTLVLCKNISQKNLRKMMAFSHHLFSTNKHLLTIQ